MSSQKAHEKPAQIMSFIFQLSVAGVVLVFFSPPEMSLLREFTAPDVRADTREGVRAALEF